jgi:hypothetical protein
MFGNKMKMKGGGGSDGVPAEAGKKAKEKPKSPKEQLIEKLEKVAPGTEIAFRLPEMYGPEIIVVAGLKEYPAKGHRYAVLGAKPVDGKPGPQRNTIWEVNKSKPIAEWLAMRSATELS